MTKPTFDQDFWEQLWSRTLREHDRPHLGAERVIEHHHWVWANLLAPRPVTIARAADL